MSRPTWHMQRDGTEVLLSRRLPPRFDIAAEARLPGGLRRGALAHEIRKDLWRALQGVRGFSPAVLVRNVPAGLAVRAGGAVLGRAVPIAHLNQQIADLLGRPDLRARWIAHCARACDEQGLRKGGMTC